MTAETAQPATRTGDVEMAAGRRLRELRESAGWSQEDMAARMTAHGCPWHQSTVFKIEHGMRVIRAGELPAVAEIFSVQVADMLGADGPALAESRALLERTIREQIAAEICSGPRKAGDEA